MGVEANWEKVFQASVAKSELPNYPWQKEYFWPDESRGKQVNNALEKRNGKTAHPFLNKRIDLPEGKRNYYLGILLEYASISVFKRS
jgi:acyl transferase domain-containing protein